MSVIRPFKGFRPAKGFVEKIASLPYDVMNTDEARQMAKDNPYSFLHVVRSEIDLEEGLNPYSEKVYKKAGENLQKLINDKALVQDEKPSYYIYQQTMNGHTQKGLLVGASIDEYANGLIKKHEFTRKAKEDDRVNHVENTNANTGPVFLTYRNKKEISDTINSYCANHTPAYDFTPEDGVRHVLWPVSETQDVENFTNLFTKVEALYVADGHHRAASAFRVGKKRGEQNTEANKDASYNYFMAVLFPDNELKIMGYYRAIADLNGNSNQEFIDKIKEKFEVIENGNPEPKEAKSFGMYLDGKWFTLRAKKGTYPETDPVKGLDASILQENLLNPILGIDDPRTNNRIDFIGGIRGTVELEKRVANDMKVAFSLYPVSLNQLMAVADAGEVMPPKSTWFEPKLRSGIIVRSLND